MVVNLRPQDTGILTVGLGAVLIKRASHFVGSMFPVVRQTVPAPFGKAAETAVGSALVYILAPMVLPSMSGQLRDAAVLGVALAVDEAMTAANVLNFEDFESYYSYDSFAEVVPEESVQSLAEVVPEETVQSI